MRDLVLLGHIALGIVSLVFCIVILLQLNKKPWFLKQLALLTAAINWTLLFPAGVLYLNFYPATKSLIKAGAWPWAHAIVMETKEHWGLLLPFIATLAAWLVYKGEFEESRKWWLLLAVATLLIAIMGRIVKMGAAT